jgi:protease IV
MEAIMPLEHSESLGSTPTTGAALPTTLDPTINLPASTVNQWSSLMAQHLKEQSTARRWKYIFRAILLVLFLIAVLWPILRGSSNTSAALPHVALIKLEGTIEYGSAAGAEPMTAALQAAFEDSASVAVVMQMNSPGGSPVQAAMIYDEINRLRSKYNKPVYAVVEEICASGCYYVAAAADDIYVNPASMIGSIGVLMDGFGVPELMKKLGVERRLYTAGSNKGMLDPFSPSSDKQKEIIVTLLKDVHLQFINAVKEGRGDNLSKDPDIFSGRIYSGTQGVALGLADEFVSVNGLARDVIKVDNIVDYSPKDNIAERVAKRLGASFGAGAMHSLLKSTDYRSIQ